MTSDTRSVGMEPRKRRNALKKTPMEGVMPDDMKAVVERLERMIGPAGSRETLLASDLRALLSERRKMVEALDAVRSWDMLCDALPDKLAMQVSAALTGSREQEADNGR